MRKLLLSSRHFSVYLPTSKMCWTPLVILLISLAGSHAFSAEVLQDDTPLGTRLGLSCTQLADQQIAVQARIRARVDGQYVAIPNAEVKLYNRTDSADILLGMEISDQDGFVELMINAKDRLLLDDDGYYNVTASYEGDNDHKSSERELLFKPVTLDIVTTESDSVNTLTIQLNEQSINSLPVTDVEVALQVPRMFSDLTIVTDFTDDDGMVEFVFPNDIPGGTKGELLIMVQIADTDDYASIKSQLQTNWGVPTERAEQESRTLWSPNAPIWMVLTFAFLMIMVWGHFLIIIRKLYLIQKEGKYLEAEA